MGLYLRKSVSVGPLRFNLSGSGIGVSCGIPGLRIGTGPRGNYISAGRGGIYYRKTFSTTPKPRPPRNRARPADVIAYDATVGEFRNVASGTSVGMHSGSSA